MTRAIVILLVLGAVVGAYLLATGALEDDGRGKAVIQDRPQPGIGDEPAGATLGPGPSEAPGPRQVTPAMLPVSPPAKALFLAAMPLSFNELVLVSLETTKGLSVAAWYTERLDSKRPGPAAGRAKGMPALETAPTGAWLEEQDIRVLVLAGLDPNSMPMAFWNAVEDRVRRGVMGVWFHAQFPVGANNEWITVHPALSHPVLSKLLPVERAAELSADPVPGLYPEARPILLTAEGRRHPASRLLPEPDEAAALWRLAAEGEHGWRTKFVYPVEKSREGANVLVEVQSVGAEAWPAMIAAKDARVLWVGLADFGQQSYYSSDSHSRMVTLINNGVVWLAGP